MKYIMQDLNDPTKYKIEDRSSAAGSVCPLLVDEPIEHLDIVDDINEDTGEPQGKKAILNPAKKAAAQIATTLLEAAAEAVAYKSKRRVEYPSELDVIEALMEDKEGRPEKLAAITAQRAAVKAKYPKPS